MSTDNQDPPDDKKKSKDKTDYEKANQKGGVSPSDERVFEFLDALFVDETHFPESIEVRQVSGRNFDRMGEPVRKIPFTSATKPTKERLVQIANDIVFRIRVDCDIRKRETMYHIAAKNPQLGAEFYDRILFRGEPTGKWKKRAGEFGNGLNGDGMGEEDEDEIPFHSRYNIERLGHDREMFNLYRGAMEGLIDRSDRHATMAFEFASKMQDKYIESLEANILLVKQDDERKANADKQKIYNEALVGGLNIAKALLPQMIAKKDGGTVWHPGDDSPDALTLREFVKIKSEDGMNGTLTKEQFATVFGNPNEGLAGGILTPSQSYLIAAISEKLLSPDSIDMLLVPGPLQVSQEQIAALMSCGVDQMKLAPLQALFENRIKRRAAIDQAHSKKKEDK